MPNDHTQKDTPQKAEASIIEEQNSNFDPERQVDFGKAYKELVKKFYYQQDQGANILIPEEDLMRVEEEEYNANRPGFDAEDMKRRIEEQKRAKEDKLEYMRREQEAKEMEGCTFAPQLIRKGQKQSITSYQQQEDEQPSQFSSIDQQQHPQRRDLN